MNKKEANLYTSPPVTHYGIKKYTQVNKDLKVHRQGKGWFVMLRMIVSSLIRSLLTYFMIFFKVKSQKQKSQIANLQAKSGSQLLLMKSLIFNC